MGRDFGPDRGVAAIPEACVSRGLAADLEELLEEFVGGADDAGGGGITGLGLDEA
jgi:hypothetical protein